MCVWPVCSQKNGNSGKNWSASVPGHCKAATGVSPDLLFGCFTHPTLSLRDVLVGMRMEPPGNTLQREENAFPGQS